MMMTFAQRLAELKERILKVIRMLRTTSRIRDEGLDGNRNFSLSYRRHRSVAVRHCIQQP
jgi:hypothetical protein